MSVKFVYNDKSIVALGNGVAKRKKSKKKMVFEPEKVIIKERLHNLALPRKILSDLTSKTGNTIMSNLPIRVDDTYFKKVGIKMRYHNYYIETEKFMCWPLYHLSEHKALSYYTRSDLLSDTALMRNILYDTTSVC